MVTTACRHFVLAVLVCVVLRRKGAKMAVSVSGPTPIGPTTIGPVPWRDNTMSGIKDNNKVIGRSDETVRFGRSVDPLPHVRFVSVFCHSKGGSMRGDFGYRRELMGFGLNG